MEHICDHKTICHDIRNVFVITVIMPESSTNNEMTRRILNRQFDYEIGKPLVLITESIHVIAPYVHNRYFDATQPPLVNPLLMMTTN